MDRQNLIHQQANHNQRVDFLFFNTSGETTEEHVHAEGEEHEHGETTTVETTTANADAQYTCPMKCEGDKTYASADDKCGKCGMDLALVEEAKTQTEEEHNHEH